MPAGGTQLVSPLGLGAGSSGTGWYPDAPAGAGLFLYKAGSFHTIGPHKPSFL